MSANDELGKLTLRSHSILQEGSRDSQSGGQDGGSTGVSENRASSSEEASWKLRQLRFLYGRVHDRMFNVHPNRLPRGRHHTLRNNLEVWLGGIQGLNEMQKIMIGVMTGGCDIHLDRRLILIVSTSRGVHPHLDLQSTGYNFPRG